MLWHHKPFNETAIRMYVQPISKNNPEMFENIIDFHNESWKDSSKPLEPGYLSV
jgi:hypothetical protein